MEQIGENFILFDDVSFSDLMKDVYVNSKKKDLHIEKCIQDLTELIKSPDDAAILVPVIKEYFEVSVKNDEQLVKLTGIIQRFLSSTLRGKGDENFGISEEEKLELLQIAQEEIQSIKDQQIKDQNE